ncbi:MAG TPA: P-loop NTPase [Gemmatimonadaceae bacterium]|jgi:pilus assembly protein CpaE
MSRRALIAQGAAGSQETVAEVLARFGFTEVRHARDRTDALDIMRQGPFDLVMIPLQDIAPAELLTLEREIRKAPTMSVIGTAPTADPDLILRAMRSGMHEFLVYPPSAQELGGAIERLMWRTTTEGHKGKLFAVYSGKGGLGATSLAVNLAQALAMARTNARVALADLVVTGGDVRIFLNLQQAYDLGDLVAKGDKVDAELLNSLLTPCPGGVWALPTGDNPELEEFFDAATIASIIDLLRTHFGVTVVDCEHSLNERTLAALDAADRVLLVTHLSIPALRSTQRTLSICRRLGYDDEKICVVVNRHLSADVLPLTEAEELLESKIYAKLPNDFQLSGAALHAGVPVITHQPSSRLARGYVDLARKLSGAAPITNGTDPTGRGASRLRSLFRTKGAGNVT